MPRLLWSDYPQQPYHAMDLTVPKKNGRSQSTATESGPAMANADGDSVEAIDHR
jgi:hypothetical protein